MTEFKEEYLGETYLIYNVDGSLVVDGNVISVEDLEEILRRAKVWKEKVNPSGLFDKFVEPITVTLHAASSEPGRNHTFLGLLTKKEAEKLVEIINGKNKD